MDDRLPYLAGFFDGEGHIALRPGRKTATLSVTQVDRRPLDLFAEVFGGTVSARKHDGNPAHRPSHRWDLHAGSAPALIAMRPWLIVKADEADRAIASARESFNLKVRLEAGYTFPELDGVV